MRKRSDVASAASAADAPKVTKKDGMQFVECPDCGLKPSAKMALATSPPSCPRCGTDIPMTVEQIAEVAREVPRPDRAAESVKAAGALAKVIGEARFPGGSARVEVAKDEEERAEEEERVAQAKSNADWAMRKAGGDPDKARALLVGEIGDRATREDVDEAMKYLPPSPKQPPLPSASLVEQVGRKPDEADVGELVSYTWGECMFRVGDFSNFKVGPFHAETRVRPGETKAHAIARLRRDVDGQAQDATEAKRDWYLQALLGLKRAVEGGK